MRADRRPGEHRLAGSASGGALPRWPAGVIFDLDGTLADSFGAIAAALNRALAEAGRRARPLRWVERHVGRGAAALVADALALPAASEPVRTALARFRDEYGATFVAATPPLPHALRVVRFVAGVTGGRVGVVSNKDAALSRLWLDGWGFAPYVAALSGPDASGHRKPEAAAAAPVLAAIGARAADTLMVGDMDIDVQTARNAGMPAVAVHGVTSSRADLSGTGALAVLETLAELPSWLASHGRGWPSPATFESDSDPG